MLLRTILVVFMMICATVQAAARDDLSEKKPLFERVTVGVGSWSSPQAIDLTFVDACDNVVGCVRVSGGSSVYDQSKYPSVFLNLSDVFGFGVAEYRAESGEPPFLAFFYRRHDRKIVVHPAPWLTDPYPETVFPEHTEFVMLKTLPRQERRTRSGILDVHYWKGIGEPW